jgi:hypothetical protein
MKNGVFGLTHEEHLDLRKKAQQLKQKPHILVTGITPKGTPTIKVIV